MQHVFVETNWVFAYAAPAHHQVPDAVQLLDRARQGECRLHLPNLCLAEARRAILTKCQPRTEADALRRFLSWAGPAGRISAADQNTTRTVLDKYESSMKQALAALDTKLQALRREPCIDVFALNDAMLDRATQLYTAGIECKPFDHAILAGIVVRATELWEAGERPLSFCQTDKDLQPWDNQGNPKPPLRDLYDQAHVWVYGDFTLTEPERRKDFA